MFKTFRQKGIKLLAIFIAIALFLIPEIHMTYADSETGTLGVYAKCDSNIKLSESDIFEIRYELNDTGETGCIELNASAVSEAFHYYDLHAGTYTITKIIYLGTNQEIIAGGYGTKGGFRLTSGGDALLYIYIGEGPVRELDIEYNNAIIMDNEHNESGERVIFYDENGNAYKYGEDEDGNRVMIYLEESDPEDSTSPSSEPNDANNYDGSYEDVFGSNEIPQQTQNGQKPVVEYYDQDGLNKDSGGSLSIVTTLVVVLILAFMTFGSLYVLHKKGKI